MTVDMSQFYQTFFEESFEGLDRMEAELLNLDVGAADSETINTIFRAAHSIKGGAGTFGFDNLAKFTHVLETLLDKMRSGETMVTQTAVDAMLQSVDCLRDMLSGAKEGTSVDQENAERIKLTLQALLTNGPAPAGAETATAGGGTIPVVDDRTGLQIEILESSFKLLAPQGERLVALFYQRLFERFPTVKPLFEKSSPAEQQKKLLAALQLVMNNLRQPDKLLPALKQLGAKHQSYGAVAAHYQAVADTMISTMEELAGDAWNDQYGVAWAQAFNTVADIMQQGYSAEGAHKVAVASADGWRVKFYPNENLLRSGNDPVRILRELASLGSAKVEVDDNRLPLFQDINPEVCYFGWVVTLTGEVTEKQIREVFAWVEDECELTIAHGDEVQGEPQSASPMAATPHATVASAPHLPAAAPAVPIVATPQVASVDAPKPHSVSPATASAPKPAPVASSAAVLASAQSDAAAKKAAAANSEQGSIRVSTDKIDALINMVGELVITQSMLGQLGENVDLTRLDKLRDGLTQLERNTRELQESVMRIRMLPISFVFQRFPRMVRDLAQKLGKNVELKLSGEATELDKTVMEKIGDPMVHLVRNAIDHGVETPDIRAAAGKSPVGIVHLNAFHQGGNIVIEITDDGAGLNRERICAKARERGIISADQTLSEEQIFDLIFEPGFSTAQVVSDVSGRGVGMDVVKKNIRSLGGSIEIKSVEGQGSKFTIRLPLTLAILDGQLVRVGKDTYIIPLVSIIESLQARADKINAIAGQAELYKLREDYIPVARLYELFNIQPDSTELTKGLLVVVEGDGERIALFVDDLLGQQQVVIKSLETNFKRVEGVSGATILGDGTVALILDIGGVIKLSRDPSAHSRRELRPRKNTGAGKTVVTSDNVAPAAAVVAVSADEPAKAQDQAA